MRSGFLLKIMTLLAILLVNINTSFGQYFLPKPTEYDSIKERVFMNFLYDKKYYKGGTQIFEINYRKTGTFYAYMHSYIKGDSCYTSINGYSYNFFIFDGDTVTNKKCAANSNILYCTKTQLSTQDTIEQGRYYVLRNNTNNIVQSEKYKIGIWNTYKNGKIIKSIDYDNFKINGEKIVFDKNMNSSFNNQKLFADSILCYYFGSQFFEKYLKFNLGRSCYFNLYGKRIPFENALNDSDCSILTPRLYYDIVINDSVRFNPIKMQCYKVKTLNEFLTETNAFTIHIEGIDSSLTMFNEKAIDFIRIAKKYRYNIRSKDFFLEMIVEPKDECFAKYSFKMSEYKDKNISYKGKKYRGYFKTIIIDPKTGVIKELPREAEIIYESTEL